MLSVRVAIVCAWNRHPLPLWRQVWGRGMWPRSGVAHGPSAARLGGAVAPPSDAASGPRAARPPSRDLLHSPLFSVHKRRPVSLLRAYDSVTAVRVEDAVQRWSTEQRGGRRLERCEGCGRSWSRSIARSKRPSAQPTGSQRVSAGRRRKECSHPTRRDTPVATPPRDAPYSDRSAHMGLTREARRAGRYAAPSATIMSTTASSYCRPRAGSRTSRPRDQRARGCGTRDPPRP